MGVGGVVECAVFNGCVGMQRARPLGVGVGVVWGGVGVGLGGCCRVCTVEMVGRGVAWVRW